MGGSVLSCVGKQQDNSAGSEPAPTSKHVGHTMNTTWGNECGHSPHVSRLLIQVDSMTVGTGQCLSRCGSGVYEAMVMRHLYVQDRVHKI